MKHISPFSFVPYILLGLLIVLASCSSATAPTAVPLAAVETPTTSPSDTPSPTPPLTETVAPTLAPPTETTTAEPTSTPSPSPEQPATVPAQSTEAAATGTTATPEVTANLLESKAAVEFLNANPVESMEFEKVTGLYSPIGLVLLDEIDYEAKRLYTAQSGEEFLLLGSVPVAYIHEGKTHQTTLWLSICNEHGWVTEPGHFRNQERDLEFWRNYFETGKLDETNVIGMNGYNNFGTAVKSFIEDELPNLNGPENNKPTTGITVVLNSLANDGSNAYTRGGGNEPFGLDAMLADVFSRQPGQVQSNSLDEFKQTGELGTDFIISLGIISAKQIK